MYVRYFNLTARSNHKRSLIIGRCISIQLIFIIMEDIMSELSIRQYIESIELTEYDFAAITGSKKV